jgi:tRNA A-37 threonylcarbamoyl transferase component Bud32
MTSMAADVPTPQRPPLVGQRFVILRRIGRGGSASVYAAYDLRLRTWRAVKVLHPDLAEDEELRDRFVLEAAAMANLEHPNVVRVSDVVHHDVAIPYIVMEWLEGGSVSTWLHAHGPMPLDLALDVMIAVSEALEFVHGHKVIHRDVNPRNVLIDRWGVPKLTDFGVARIAVDTSALVVDLDRHPTEIGTVMGTEAYMAPEQRRDSATVDERADVYSSGAMLYTLLTGRIPPDLSTTGPADSRIRRLPPLVAPLVVRACAYLPDDRHPDAGALRSALIRLRTRLPPSDTRAKLVPKDQGLPPYAPWTLDPDDAASLDELVESGATSGVYDGRAEVPEQASDERSNLLIAGSAAVFAAAAVVVAMVFVLVVGIGTHGVSEARGRAVEAEGWYHQVLARHRPADGAPEVQAAYQRLDHAPPRERAKAAEAVYTAVRQHGEAAADAVDDLDRARQGYLDAYGAWRREAAGGAGRVAVAVGWATGPE